MRTYKKREYSSFTTAFFAKHEKEKKVLIEAIREKIEKLDRLIIEYDKAYKKYPNLTQIPSDLFTKKEKITEQCISREQAKRSLLCSALSALHGMMGADELLQEYLAKKTQIHRATSAPLFSTISTTKYLVNQVLIFYGASIQEQEGVLEHSVLTPLLQDT